MSGMFLCLGYLLMYPHHFLLNGKFGFNCTILNVVVNKTLMYVYGLCTWRKVVLYNKNLSYICQNEL